VSSEQRRVASDWSGESCGAVTRWHSELVLSVNYVSIVEGNMSRHMIYDYVGCGASGLHGL